MMTLEEYFGDRHWRHDSLQSCVAAGMRLAEEMQQPFTWLCTTNRGASEVCEAALELLGVTSDEIAQGYLCDQTSKSELRIVAKVSCCGSLAISTRAEGL